MSVTINLPAETVQRLREAAARRGETLEAYLEWLAIQCGGNGSGSSPDQTAEE